MQKIKEFYHKNEKQVDLSIFLGGFFFDILTLGRPDDAFNILQQSVYLSLLLILLKLEIQHEIFQKPIGSWLNKLWPYRRFVTHFLYGSLLSVYTLLYFKSSSFIVSFSFIFLIAIIMILNELPFIQNIGVKVRTVLWSLCFGSFLAMQSPTLFGFIGWIPFTTSMAVAALAVFGFSYGMNKQLNQQKMLKSLILVPGLSTFLVLFVLYVLKILPPVPLSLEYAGIYHRIEKQGSTFNLIYDRPAWKFWQNGAQSFAAVPGDKVSAYVEVFAPANFKDRITIKWYFDEPKSGWTLYDSIPLNITGGRASGFRGYATKSNYTPGSWQVRAETSDGREIGRLSFEIELAEATAQRNFQIDSR